MTTTISGDTGVSQVQAAAIQPDDLAGAQSGSAPIFGCRAWASFAGATAGTHAPTAGGNIASIVRNAVGDYTVNFTTAMPTANYAVFISVVHNATITHIAMTVGSKLTTSFQFTTVNAGVGAVDPTQVTIGVVG